MDVYMIVLRLIHILTGVLWAGAAFFSHLFMQPAVKAAGPDGGKFMSVFARTTKVSQIIASSAGLTILSGALMYWQVSGGFSSDWLGTGGGITLTAAAVLGILGYLGPGLTLARTQVRIGALSAAMAAAGGPPTAEQQAEIRELSGKARTYTMNAAVILAIVVAGMAIARYV